jgi:hypothetical protein
LLFLFVPPKPVTAEKIRLAEQQIAQAKDKSAYLHLIADKALKLYFPPHDYAFCEASVCFSLDCKGKTSDAKVEEHLRNYKTRELGADAALVYAVQALELPPPPAGLGCPVRLKLVIDTSGKGPAKRTVQVIEKGSSDVK